MHQKAGSFLQQYLRIAFALIITLCLMRVYEYVVVAYKSFTPHAYQYELAGLLYDVWLGFIYCAVVFVPVALISRINKQAAFILFHTLNVLLIICCLALLLTFSERNNPFD